MAKLGQQVEYFTQADPGQTPPCVSFIACINSDGTVNVGGFDANGGAASAQGIPLLASDVATNSAGTAWAREMAV